MSPLVEKIVRGVRDGGLLRPGARVVAAVSGGGDSVALVHLLAEAARPLGITLVGIVHLHHGLRGEEADADLACVRRHAEALALPLHEERADVGALAQDLRCSVEAAGRCAREACYARALEALSATHVATGHTMDDQAETVLLRLGRGAGVAALSGIRPARGPIVRPLLGARRQELRDYLSARSLEWREDASNADAAILRNRVRHEVMPVLAAALSPRVVEALARAAALAAAEDALVADAAGRAAPAVVEGDALDVAALLAQPVAIRRRIVHAWLSGVSPAAVGAAHVEAVLALTTGAREGVRISLPGTTVARAGKRLVVARAGRADEPEAIPGKSHPEPRRLPVPGVLSLVDVGLQVAVTRMPAGQMGVDGPFVGARQPDTAVVDADAAGECLAVRFRRPGDRLRPLGMAGRKKLQDLLVDRKVPRALRDRVPLVVDASDRIIWVAGHAIAADVRVTAATTRVLLLQLQQSGGVV